MGHLQDVGHIMIEDIRMMHRHFGVDRWLMENEEDPEKLRKLLELRMAMIQEEVDETQEAIDAKDPEEIVDGLIDIVVFALGTLDILNVDTLKAWDEVYTSNMMKIPGVKASRPNPLGLPDLIKPNNWIAPSHEGNHGDIERFL